ncbi:MAG: hypothetical protein V4450_17830 [Bacteroidota bacterium]
MKNNAAFIVNNSVVIILDTLSTPNIQLAVLVKHRSAATVAQNLEKYINGYLQTIPSLKRKGRKGNGLFMAFPDNSIRYGLWTPDPEMLFSSFNTVPFEMALSKSLIDVLTKEKTISLETLQSVAFCFTVATLKHLVVSAGVSKNALVFFYNNENNLNTLYVNQQISIDFLNEHIDHFQSLAELVFGGSTEVTIDENWLTQWLTDLELLDRQTIYNCDDKMDASKARLLFLVNRNCGLNEYITALQSAVIRSFVIDKLFENEQSIKDKK